MALADVRPAVQVDPAEYARLLGYPRGHRLEGRAAVLAAEAEAWYAEHGRPWIFAREAATLALDADGVRLDGRRFASARLRQSLVDAGAHGAVLVAVGAGPELEAEAARRWLDEKPDEYFFLEVYGSAVVEHLVTQAGARLCGWADALGLAVLPHDSPGYPEWDIAEQAALHGLLTAESPLPGVLEVLESGALRPKKSLIAVFGLTRHVERLTHLRDLVPCERCAFTPCQYRRAPYRRGALRSTARAFDEPSRADEPVLDAAAAYTVNARALRRWAAERLTLTPRDDGSTDALFRYEGTTCSNMGYPLRFEYHVRLGPRRDGYPIDGQRCVPAAGDTGYTKMCNYQGMGDALIELVDGDAPLAGQPLGAIIGWQRPTSVAGCYCDDASRVHKWGLVLETIHYALAQVRQERPLDTTGEP
ncbi:MAG: hypothetical protein ABIT71_08545 [Vicinamibacteraceae bacterium]